MKKLLLILLCVPLIFSCGESDTNKSARVKITPNPLLKTITNEMIDDGYTGKGTYRLPNFLSYRGEFKDGLYHGQGTMVWFTGEKHEGEWKDGMMHGEGTYTDVHGTIEKGLWKYDEFIVE